MPVDSCAGGFSRGFERLDFSRDRKKLLIDEGSIMASLNHERVVKLLGVILEDRDCSLVMELIPRGNLLAMLQTVSRLRIQQEKIHLSFIPWKLIVAVVVED